MDCHRACVLIMSSAEPPLSPSAFTTLYSDHHSWLQGWLIRRLGNAWDAADLAQDTFLRVLGRPAPGHEPRALLTHIAKGLVVDRWRRQAVEQAYLQTVAQLPEALAPSPESRLLILETLYRLEAMLHALPALTRQAFLMSQLDGLTYGAIAEQLGVSLITVKRHMRTAFIACLSLD